MIVSNKHIHIHVPKTGGSSLQSSAKSNDWYTPIKAHATLPEIYNYFDISGFYKTVTVRNPWDHAVSMYYQILTPSSFLSKNFFNLPYFCKEIDIIKQKIVTDDISFINFLEKTYQNDWYQSKYNIESKDIKFDKWFKYEEYKEIIEFLNFKYKTNLKNIEVNITANKKLILDIIPVSDYRNLYCERTYNIVKELSNK